MLGQVRLGPLFPSAFADHDTSTGGTGGYKLGSNYAAGVVPQQKAAALGYQQILWLYGAEHRLTEVGTMNLFIVIEDKDGSEAFGSARLDAR